MKMVSFALKISPRFKHPGCLETDLCVKVETCHLERVNGSA